ncbi:hypothetical protein, partial [Mesorhizobium sp.]|uniref:hypothetical protein n=1 Tax=Mesorhizobium sp. TaxID=1871066 RepID=UPI0025F7006F
MCEQHWWCWQRTGGARESVMLPQCAVRRVYAAACICTPGYDQRLKRLARAKPGADLAAMADRDDRDFRVRPGRVRSGGTHVNPRSLPFVDQVKIAVRKAGGSQGRGGGSAGGKG